MKPGTYPIFVLFFRQAWLKIPFDPLLIEFQRASRLHLGRLNQNTVRIVLGIAELNMRCGLSLDVHDIKYYYSLGQNQNDRK